jgi:hypothetical protein
MSCQKQIACDRRGIDSLKCMRGIDSNSWSAIARDKDCITICAAVARDPGRA